MAVEEISRVILPGTRNGAGGKKKRGADVKRRLDVSDLSLERRAKRD